jgi:hypothetical protein
MPLDHLQGRFAFGPVAGRRRIGLYDEARPVLHQRMPNEAELRRRIRTLAVELGVGAGCRACVSLLRFSPWKSRSPLRPGAGGSSLASRARKLFKLAHASTSVPSTEKWSSERKRFTWAWRSTASRNFAATQEVVVQLLHELTLGAHRVEGLKKRGAQKPLWRDRLAAGALVELLEFGVERAQGVVDDGLDHPQRMFRWHPALEVDIGEQRP